MRRFAAFVVHMAEDFLPRLSKAHRLAALDGVAAQNVQANRRFDRVGHFAGIHAKRRGLQFGKQLAALERAQRAALHGGGAVRIAQRRLGEAVFVHQGAAHLVQERQSFDLLARVIESHQDMAHGAGFRPAERLRMLAVVTLGVFVAGQFGFAGHMLQQRLHPQIAQHRLGQAGLVQPDGVQLGGQFFGAGVTRGERVQPRVQLGVAHPHVFRFAAG